MSEHRRRPLTPHEIRNLRISRIGLRKGYDTRAADPDLSDDDRELAREKSTLTSAVLTWISGLVASIPEPAANGNVPLQQVVTAALAYLERTTARAAASSIIAPPPP